MFFPLDNLGDFNCLFWLGVVLWGWDFFFFLVVEVVFDKIDILFYAYSGKVTLKGTYSRKNLFCLYLLNDMSWSLWRNSSYQ